MARRRTEDVERDLEQIRITALRHFAQKSYEKASLDDICQEVGCTRGVLYHHFSDKQDLYTVVVKSTLDQGYASFFKRVASLKPLQQFYQWHLLNAEEIEKGEDFSRAVELAWIRKGTGRQDNGDRAQIDTELVALVEHHSALLKTGFAAKKEPRKISFQQLSLQCNSLSIGLTLSWFLTGRTFSLREELAHGIRRLAEFDFDSK